MMFDMQMRWNIEGRLKLDEFWDLEVEEGKAAKDRFKLIGMDKVAGQRHVIDSLSGIYQKTSTERLLAVYPRVNSLSSNSLRTRRFLGLFKDCKSHFGTKPLHV